jgi:hypothetical protein
MNLKNEKWNSRRRKFGATSFVVIPLKSWLYGHALHRSQQQWKHV